MRLLPILALAASVAGCGSPRSVTEGAGEPTEWTFAGRIMGTRYSVVVLVDQTVEALGEEALGDLILAQLTQVDSAMSTWKPDSEVSRFNRHRSTDPFPVSAETLQVVAGAQQVSGASGGAFDVTVGPLVDAWGFGADEPTEPPAEQQLAALSERVGYRKLTVDLAAATLTKLHPELEINLSAIAKGYAVDRVVQALKESGVASALVDVGGEVYALGRPAPDRKWRVAIERPDGSGETQRILELENQALATSGDYRNFRTLDDGRTVSHLFDPRTQAPMQHAGASVSVIAPDCTTADAWATALFVLGPKEGLKEPLPRETSALYLAHGNDGLVALESSGD